MLRNSARRLDYKIMR
ncbi:hypothetical protein PSW01_16660 [Shigella flexneri]|nr:hypothetical protein [Escherichia coli]MDC9841011.1 hypothetical protein [Shigella flexneri]MDC9853770.1 hypothetical protein [Shigella flexneri]MDC9899925.1 hypothetical protein [Shigella flexneri]MDC9916613.1 hypothetical protein [Shigella flexneri]MDZ9079361.1 hypothetical protein [Escherichia coli]